MEANAVPDLDRRTAARLQRTLDIVITLDGHALPVHRVVDISLGGLLVELAAGDFGTELRLQAIARIALHAGAASAVCSGRVCRIRHVAHAGHGPLPRAVAFAFTAATDAFGAGGAVGAMGPIGAIGAIVDALRVP